MKKAIIFILLLTTCLSVFGQQDNQRSNNTLRGKMLFLSSGKTPAVGVAVSGKISQKGIVAENANTVYTADNGDYSLKFPEERDGHYVNLTIGEEDQYGESIELVNAKEVEQCRIPANASDEFEIIVCRKGARDDMAKKYYKIIKTSSDIALAKKKREFDALLAEREKDYTKITELGEKIKQLEKQTDSIAIYKAAFRIASVNKDNASDRVLEYIAALDEGKTVEEALEVLSVDLASKEADDAIDKFNAAIEELELRAEGSVAVFDYRSAIACYDTIIVKCERIGIDALTIASYYNSASTTIRYSGKFKKALEYGQKSLEVLKKKSAYRDSDLVGSYNNIGNAYQVLGQYEKALEFHQKAIRIIETTLGYEHLDLTALYGNIGNTYLHLGQYEKALEFHQKTIAIREKILKTKHPDLATSYNNIAATYEFLRQYEKALEFHQKAIAIREKILDAKHTDLAISYNNIASTYEVLRQYERALKFRQKAMSIMKEILDTKHPDLATFYNNISVNYQRLGQYKKALEVQQKVIKIREEVLDPSHPSIGISYNNIAFAYQCLGQYKIALEFQQKAIQILNKVLPEKHPNRQRLLNNLLGIYYAKASDAFSKKDYTSALKDFSTLNEYVQDSEVWKYIGLCHYYLCNYSNAITAYKNAIDSSREVRKEHLYDKIGRAYLKNKQFKEAKKTFMVYEKRYSEAGSTFRNWAMYYAFKNKKEKAISNLKKAVELGYKDIEWLKTDDSMDSLRKEKEFIEIIKQLEKEAKE